MTKELQSLQTSPPEGIRIHVDEANLSNLTGWIGEAPPLVHTLLLLATIAVLVARCPEAACLLTLVLESRYLDSLLAG